MHRIALKHFLLSFVLVALCAEIATSQTQEEVRAVAIDTDSAPASFSSADARVNDWVSRGEQQSRIDRNDYLIQAKDVLKIVVYDEPDLSTEQIRVSIDGHVNLPLVGKVTVAGLNASQIEDRIEELLKDGFILSPQVSVLLEEYGRRIIHVLGSVGGPGSYTIGEDVTLLEIITSAGGLTTFAGELILVKRMIDGVQETIEIDRKKLFEDGDLSQNLKLFHNDFVFATKSDVIYVLGEVESPGRFVWDKELTVFQAILRAGGVSQVAARKKIKLVRSSGGKRDIIFVNLDDFTKEGDLSKDVPLLPDDIVIVPQSLF